MLTNTALRPLRRAHLATQTRCSGVGSVADQQQQLLLALVLDQLAERQPAAERDVVELRLVMHPRRRRAGGEGERPTRMIENVQACAISAALAIKLNSFEHVDLPARSLSRYRSTDQCCPLGQCGHLRRRYAQNRASAFERHRHLASDEAICCTVADCVLARFADRLQAMSTLGHSQRSTAHRRFIGKVRRCMTASPSGTRDSCSRYTHLIAPTNFSNR